MVSRDEFWEDTRPEIGEPTHISQQSNFRNRTTFHSLRVVVSDSSLAVDSD